MRTGPRLTRAERYPRLDERTILSWADAYDQKHGRWPSRQSGDIPESPGDTWVAIDIALRRGFRGLEPGSSLSKLLQKHRAKPNPALRPDLTEEWIVTMAKGYFFSYGKYPNRASGLASARFDMTWGAIDAALRNGSGGLPGGSSLSRLLKEQCGVRNRQDLPSYEIEEILKWADAHCARKGVYPTRTSGAIREAPGETWYAVNSALIQGGRGMEGGSSLARLLAEKRGVKNIQGLPKLTDEQILAWADAYYEKHGVYPDVKSGVVDEAPEETWYRIHESLRIGLRGLPKGRSLFKLLKATGRKERRAPSASKR